MDFGYIAGIGLILWGFYDIYSGKSTFIHFPLGSAEYNQHDDGWVYWLVVGGKLICGIRLIGGF